MNLTAIAASPNGSRVGLAASDGFKLLDAKTGKPIDGSTPEDGAADKTRIQRTNRYRHRNRNRCLIRRGTLNGRSQRGPGREAKSSHARRGDQDGKRQQTDHGIQREQARRGIQSRVRDQGGPGEDPKPRRRGWVHGHSPDDAASGSSHLRPSRPKTRGRNHTRFLATLTAKAIKQLNKAGIRDIEKHFSGKTVRVTGPISRHDYRGCGTPPEVEIVIDDLSQIEVVK